MDPVRLFSFLLAVAVGLTSALSNEANLRGLDFPWLIFGYDAKCLKIDAVIEKINTQIKRLKELRRSLINERGTGELAIIINKPC